MKNALTTFAIILAFSSNALTHNSVTNIFSKVELRTGHPGEIERAMLDISDAFNVRICSEGPRLGFNQAITYTNATLEQVFENVLAGNTNCVLKYENHNGSFYAHPSTNSISMMFYGAISITNIPLKTLFHDDVLGLKETGLRLSMTKTYQPLWADREISLEMKDAYVWQVLDAICRQLPNAKFWHIHENTIGSQKHNLLRFYTDPAIYVDGFPQWP